jgi:hypothetical protein
MPDLEHRRRTHRRRRTPTLARRPGSPAGRAREPRACRLSEKPAGAGPSPGPHRTRKSIGGVWDRPSGEVSGSGEEEVSVRPPPPRSESSG